jgi:L-malate glycosyltransferase
MVNTHLRRVMIVERRLTHYRVPLYERMRALLADREIAISVLHGQGTSEEVAKRDSGELPWATVIPAHYFLFGKICWQPLGRYLNGVDLVVLSHQNKLLYNHWLVYGPRRRRVALWGHGRNMQSPSPNGIKERFKRWSIARADWYFAYTQTVVDVVTQTGFPLARITNLNNSIDTASLRRDRDSITAEEISRLKQSLGLSGMPVGVFLGSLHSDKRLTFLFASAERLQERLPGFQCLIIGDGPEDTIVKEWADAHPWVHWVGARQGRDKALYLGCGDIMLNPGMVGLGILDSFVCGIPMVTTDCGIHSPEIAYLHSGENGLMTNDTIHDYVAAVAELLGNPAALARMRRACLISADQYSLEGMASRFVDGVTRAIAAAPR